MRLPSPTGAPPSSPPARPRRPLSPVQPQRPPPSADGRLKATAGAAERLASPLFLLPPPSQLEERSEAVVSDRLAPAYLGPPYRARRGNAPPPGLPAQVIMGSSPRAARAIS